MGSENGKRLVKVFNFVLTAGIIAYLFFRLSRIGWNKVFQSLPVTPWFYVLLLLMFFTLPFFQMIIYGGELKSKSLNLFLAMLMKRALDKDVLGYSGEMYLYLWSRKHTGLDGKTILHIVKDNIIISSMASTLLAALLLILFFLTGKIVLPENARGTGLTALFLLMGVLLFLFPLAVKFRKSIFFLSRKKICRYFSLHLFRLILVMGMQLMQWAVVMPRISWENWFTLLSLQIIITRIPFLPSRDLIFLGSGLEVSAWTQLPAAPLAGMLLAASVISKFLNFIFFILAAGYFRRINKKS